MLQSAPRVLKRRQYSEYTIVGKHLMDAVGTVLGDALVSGLGSRLLVGMAHDLVNHVLRAVLDLLGHQLEAGLLLRGQPRHAVIEEDDRSIGCNLLLGGNDGSGRGGSSCRSCGIGLAAGILASLSPGFLARTMLGYADTDLVTLFLPLLIGLAPAVWVMHFLRHPLALPFRWFQRWTKRPIPIALDEMAEQELLRPGQWIMCLGFGAGLTWGGAMFRW